MNPMNELAYIGVDPGVSGAAALLYGDEIELLDWSEPARVLGGLRAWKVLYPVALAAIEQVHVMPKDRGRMRSVNKLVVNFGWWTGAVEALGFKLKLVPPPKWQAACRLPARRRNKPKPSLAKAAELYPQVGPRLYGPRGGAKDGRSDALLIARWASQQ